MKQYNGIELLSVKNREAWRNWLEQNHALQKSVWLVYKKSAAGKRNVSYVEAVEEALCFGWIDSKSIKLDESRTIQYFSKRNANSGWSKSNKERVDRLRRDGQMHPSGIAMVKAAKKSGKWNAFDEIDSLTIPPDLLAALKRKRNAFANFDNFPPSIKRMILEWILSAKKAETREKRIEETAMLASENIRANSYPRPARKS